MAKGLDIGTCFLVGATHTDPTGMGDVSVKSVRDAFLDLDNEPATKNMLKMSKVPFIEKDDTLYIVGDAALRMANILKKEVRRPLSKGVISAGEREAEKILLMLLKEVVGEPSKPGEVCYFSVPAAPVDRDSDVVYHEAVFKKIITQLGYSATAMNEAAAVGYANSAEEGFTSLNLSWGAGMCNVALLYQTMVGMKFSTSRCLHPDFLIPTINRGIRTIQEINVGDEVIGWDGEPTKVLDKIAKKSTGENLVEVAIEEMSAFPMVMTKDHKILVKRGLELSFVEAGSLVEGDKLYKSCTELGTSYKGVYVGRKGGTNISLTSGRDLGRLIGYFLGDGSTFIKGFDGRVQLAFAAKYPERLQKYKSSIISLFSEHNINFSTDEEWENGCPNMVRMLIHSLHLAKWIDGLCYDENREKCLKLPLSRVSQQMGLGILEGILDSDSYLKEEGLSVTEVTSKGIVHVMHELLNTYGIRHRVKKRAPRMGGVNSKGVQIEGRKEIYVLSIHGRELARLQWLLENHHVPSYVDHTYYTVASVSERDPSDVYDLKVESSESCFNTFGAVVHNCGDWIDEGAAKATGRTHAQIMSIKEQGVNLLDPLAGDPKYEREREAIAVYYKNLINYVVDNIKKEFRKTESAVQIDKPLPIIISGGTSKAGNFLEFFKQEFAKVKDFPLQISEIRMASDPLADVAKGLLIAASLEQE